MKIYKILIAVLAVLLIIVYGVGCTKRIKEGEVVKKWYEPAKTDMIMVPRVIGKTTIITPIYIYDDEDFVISVQNHNEKGRLKTRRVELRKETYDAIHLGDWFVIGRTE